VVDARARGQWTWEEAGEQQPKVSSINILGTKFLLQTVETLQ